MNQRIPVAISLNQGTIVTTGGSSTFAPGNSRDALESYLRLVRRMRNQRRDPEVNLRQRDVDAMAIDLRMPADVLADELRTLMDATRSRLPMIGGTMAVVLAGAAAAIGVIAVANVMADSPATQTDTNSGVETNVPAAPALDPSSGVYLDKAGEEIEVTFGGAPAPPAP